MSQIHLKFKNLSDKFVTAVENFKQNNPDDIIRDLSSFKRMSKIIVDIKKAMQFTKDYTVFITNNTTTNSGKTSSEFLSIKTNNNDLEEGEIADFSNYHKYKIFDSATINHNKPTYLILHHRMYFDKLYDLSYITNKTEIKDLCFCHDNKKVFKLKRNIGFYNELYMEKNGFIYVLDRGYLVKLLIKNIPKKWTLGKFNRTNTAFENNSKSKWLNIVPAA